MTAGPWPRIGGSVPGPKSNPAKATRAIVRSQRPSAKQLARKQLVGKAPLGSLPARKPRARSSSTLPDFIPFATCLLVDRPPDGADWIHEIKLDGWRLQIRVEDGTATLRTRNGHDYSHSFPELARVAHGLDNCILDGEVCSVRKDGITDFSSLQSAMKSGKTAGLLCFTFDLLFLGEQDLRALPLIERKKRLQSFLGENKDQTLIQLAEHLDVAGSDVLKAACNLKLEGIVSKRLSEPCGSGRTGVWTKAKCRATQHAVVGGWTVSPKGFSGLLLGVYQGKKLVPIGRVGTGFPQKLLRWLEPRLKQLETEQSPFPAPIPRKSGRIIHYAKPELIAGFEMTSWTNDGVIRQASLQEVRERSDKKIRPDWINLPGE
jgi:bifunctional non-homologous end joining protein LigD